MNKPLKTSSASIEATALSSEDGIPVDLPHDFETALAQLEILVASMESGTLPLEESLVAYRRGVALTRICQDRLSQAEQQISVLEAGVLRALDPTDRLAE